MARDTELTPGTLRDATTELHFTLYVVIHPPEKESTHDLEENGLIHDRIDLTGEEPVPLLFLQSDEHLSWVSAFGLLAETAT